MASLCRVISPSPQTRVVPREHWFLACRRAMKLLSRPPWLSTFSSLSAWVSLKTRGSWWPKGWGLCYTSSLVGSLQRASTGLPLLMSTSMMLPWRFPVPVPVALLTEVLVCALKQLSLPQLTLRYILWPLPLSHQVELVVLIFLDWWGGCFHLSLRDGSHLYAGC